MSSTRGRRGPICRLLREDPDLADTIPVAQRAQAIQECVAMTVRIDRGHWSSDRVDIGHAGIGLLVLEGLITRSVESGAARALSFVKGQAQEWSPDA
jgi:hypothetical protein